MFFSISLYVALAIFGFGLVYKASTWFRYGIGTKVEEIPTSTRISMAMKGIVSTLISVKILTLIKVFVMDVIFQAKILRQDFLRWLMHMCLYAGFMLLLLMHALEKFISKPLFTDYYSTINPFLFLRDLFGLMVIMGIGIAIYRRFILKVPRLKTNAMDHYAIVILSVIMISGVFLKGTKITSHNEFQMMVEDYAGLNMEDDEDEVNALGSYWVQKFGMVSPNVKGPFDTDILALGQESHEANCAECHSPSQWAFLSYGIAKITQPIARSLDKANAVDWLWYIHFLSCWIGLAYLPFSKMFHIFASPLSLLANSVMEKGTSHPANIATRQIMELDACTHCCTCALNCSAGVFSEHFSNTNILPSEKILSIKALAAGKRLGENELKHIQEGIYLCTNCDRCSVVCPVGINLKDLWFNVRESFLIKGYPEFLTLSPLSFYRGLMKEDGDRDNYQKPMDQARELIATWCDLIKRQDVTLPLTGIYSGFKTGLNQSNQASTFSVCFGCKTCSNVCPVVALYDNPREVLGLLPHQIMNSCGLGLKDLALGSNMLWYCLTCYQCQEQCPQNVCVTDIFYELKETAVKNVREKLQKLDAIGHLKTIEKPTYTNVSGYQIADGYYYHLGHSWIRIDEDGWIRIGIDDFTSKVFGPADMVNLPTVGTFLKQGEVGWVLTRNDRKAPMLSPVSGTVLAVNDKIKEQPEITHDKPYEEGWLVILDPASLDMNLKRLYAEGKCFQWMEKENRVLLELLGPRYERLAATGGEPINDIYGQFPEIEWDRLVKTFLRTVE